MPDTVALFQQCRDSLDAHHDRRERIIKLSRDITALSKKLIFALHRGNFKEAEDKQKSILVLFASLAQETSGANYYRYCKSFSGAFEEYIEAIAFFHYVKTRELITKEKVDETFNTPELETLSVRTEDYLLGIADFTGEVMRYAIQMGSTGNSDQIMAMCEFLRAIGSDFEFLSNTTFPQLQKKMGALRASIGKVERACYSLQIRGSEYPKEMYQSIIREHQARYEEARTRDSGDGDGY